MAEDMRGNPISRGREKKTQQRKHIQQETYRRTHVEGGKEQI